MVLCVIFGILFSVILIKSKMHIRKDYIIKLSIFFIGIFSLFFGVSHDSFAYQGWTYEGIAYYAPKQSVEKSIPVYRFWSKKHKGHFFTASAEEKDYIIANYDEYVWKYEGIGWYAHNTKEADTVPIYRFWSKKNKHHFYTASEAEKDHVIAAYDDYVWKYEGIAWYAYSSQNENRLPIYRFWHSTNKSHFYTTNETEKNILMTGMYGPNITIGLHAYTKNELEENSFRIKSNKGYIVKNKNGTKIATIPANTTTKVKYIDDSNHTLRIYESIPEIKTTDEITFESTDGNHIDMVFEIVRPEMNFSKYRGKIKLRYSNNNNTKRIWVINELPLEQYIWGMGEITGTGPTEYNKLMTTAYRTYGYWKILYSTKYAVEGFKVNATPGNQLYYGYEWEKRYPRIRQGAEATRGKIAKHGSDVALTPYSSWTDGRTRSFEERWGSTLYPWCQSVSDPYGDYNGDYWNNAYKSTSDLMNSGNHMVGISAHGALSLAHDKNWNWDRIMKYYLDGINIVSIY